MNPIFAVFFGNLATLVLKVLAFLNSNSAAVVSDLLNDVADTIGSLLLVVGLLLSRRKVKNRLLYPFGVSRALYVFGLISVSVIGGVLFTLAVMRGVSTLVNRTPVVSSRVSVTALVLSVGVNSALVAYSAKQYFEFYRDPATVSSLIDSATDTLGTGFALLALYTRNAYVDGVGSLLNALVLLISALTLGYRYFLLLIGRSPPKEDLLRILNAILSTPGVYDVNELKAIMLTERDYLVLTEVEIESDVSVAAMERISREIESRVRRAVPEARHVVIEFVSRRSEPPTYKKLLDIIKSED